MRKFNTEGPVVADRHYCIPPLERVDLDEVLGLLESEAVVRQLSPCLLTVLATLHGRLACIIQCAVTRRHSSAGANPARQLSLQPVAVGADDGGNDIGFMRSPRLCGVGSAGRVRVGVRMDRYST